MKNIKTILVLAFLFVLSGCNSESLLVKHLYFENSLSEKFTNREDIKLSHLKTNVDSKTFFQIDINGAGSSDYYIWLGLFSEEKKGKVDIEKVSLLSNNQIVTTNEIDKSVTLDQKYKDTNFYTDFESDILLFHFKDSTLDQFSQNKEALELEIFYIINDEEKRSKKFKIDRLEYYDIAWPT